MSRAASRSGNEQRAASDKMGALARRLGKEARTEVKLPRMPLPELLRVRGCAGAPSAVSNRRARRVDIRQRRLFDYDRWPSQNIPRSLGSFQVARRATDPMTRYGELRRT